MKFQKALAVILSFLFAFAASAAGQQEVSEVLRGERYEREMSGGESHFFALALEQGDFASIVVEQKGIDVVLRLIDPEGTVLLEWDSPNGSRGDEELKFIASRSGKYQIQVASLDSRAGLAKYEFRVDEVRSERPDDKTYIIALNKSQEALSVLAQRKEGSRAKAKELFNFSRQKIDLIESDLELKASALEKIGRYYRGIGESDTALECFDKAAEIFIQIGNKKRAAGAFVNGVLAAQLEADQLERNSKALRLAKEIGDTRLEVSCLIDMAGDYYNLGELSKALETNELALELAEREGITDKVPRIHDNLGNVYTLMGRYSDAISAHQRSLDVDAANGAKEPNPGTILNIGNVYQSVGRFELAIQTYQRAFEIFEKRRIPGGAAFAISNIGVAYLATGQYDKALEYLLEAHERKQKLFRYNSASYLNLGDAYRLSGKYVQAIEYFDKAVLSSQESGESIVQRDAFQGLSLTYYDLGEYSKAESFALEAIAVASKYDQGFEYGAPMALISARLRLGKRSEATEDLKQLIRTLEQNRNWSSLDDTSKLLYMSEEAEPYNQLSSLLASEGQIDEAFELSERSKAMALTTILGFGRSNAERFMTDVEKREQTELRLKIADLNSRLSIESDTVRKEELKNQLSRSRSLLEDLGARVFARHPELKLNHGDIPPVSRNEVIQGVDLSNTAIIEFSLARDDGAIFVASGHSPGSMQLSAEKLSSKRDDVSRQIKSFRASLSSGDLSFRNASRKLYDLLIKPVEKELKGKRNIIIVPDGPLWDLPFQALMDSKGEYLIEKAAISYAPSLTALREMSKRAKTRGTTADYELIAFGNPTVGKETAERARQVFMDETLDPLPEAERLVNELDKLYGKERSSVFVGSEARESVAKSEVPKYRIVQFATHGILNNISPMYSHLVMAQNTKDTSEDGLLEAWELMDLDLNADLVILSACDTARGKISGGEGVIGMSWAAFIAGAPSIVASQWKVESSSTTELMLEFHRQLLSKKRPSKAEALRQASLKLMRSEDFSHPSYWAGFIVVGDGS